MTDFSACRRSINEAILLFGDKYVCLRHIAAVPMGNRIRFLSGILSENGASAETIQEAADLLSLSDESSPSFCGTENTKELILRCHLKAPSYRCRYYAEKYLGKPAANRFCSVCLSQRNEDRTDLERYLTKVYCHNPERFDPDPSKTASKFGSGELFSCIGEDRRCHYIELPIYQLIVTAVLQLRKENLIGKFSDPEREGRVLSQYITAKTPAFYNWKYRMNPPEAYEEIASQVTVFLRCFLNAPYRYDDHLFKSMVSDLFSETAHPGIPRYETDTFFTEGLPRKSGFPERSEDCPKASEESAEKVLGDNSSGVFYVPYGIISERIIEEPEMASPSDMMSALSSEKRFFSVTEEEDILADPNENGELKLSKELAEHHGVRFLSFSEFNKFCLLLKKYSQRLALEPAAVGDAYGLLMFFTEGEFRDQVVFADQTYLSRDFFLDITIRNGTPAVMCNLCLFLRMARQFEIHESRNARSLGGAFFISGLSEEVYPFRAITGGKESGIEDPTVFDAIRCYGMAWDRVSYGIFTKKELKKLYNAASDYENALSTSYDFLSFMGTSFENLRRPSYVNLQFTFDRYRLGLSPRYGRLLFLTVSPAYPKDPGDDPKGDYFMILLHYVFSHNDIRKLSWHLVSVQPDGIAIHVETDDRFLIESTLDALESAYTSTAKLSRFSVPEMMINRDIF